MDILEWRYGFDVFRPQWNFFAGFSIRMIKMIYSKSIRGYRVVPLEKPLVFETEIRWINFLCLGRTSGVVFSESLIGWFQGRSEQYFIPSIVRSACVPRTRLTTPTIWRLMVYLRAHFVLSHVGFTDFPLVICYSYLLNERRLTLRVTTWPRFSD